MKLRSGELEYMTKSSDAAGNQGVALVLIESLDERLKTAIPK
jgi:hypothetical protein